jgi:predicted amidohydrolase/GNAT superfamily N-acetyltransferase
MPSRRRWSVMEEINIRVRNIKLADYRDVRDTMKIAYEKMDEPIWTRPQLANLLKLFPEGQLGVEVNGKIVAVALSIVVDYDKFGDTHTYTSITGKYTFSTHDRDGDVLYGVDIFVHPDYRGMRLGRRLYDARKELCESLNLRAIIAGGRIPNYIKYADELTPKQYIEKVETKEVYDPVLTFQLSNGFHVQRVLRNYMHFDNESLSYATLLRWNNLYYEEKERLINVRPSEVRVGLVQWQMRSTASLDALFDQAEFFIDSVSAYKADFLLFPEYFMAPLMAKFNKMDEPQAIRKLAEFTQPILERFSEFAVSFNVNIITGSMPLVDDGKLYNITYLCRRDGSYESFRKIHITPSERMSYGLVGGNEIRAFDTDCGKIGVLICYDVEFPELPRLLREQGAEILFVPYMTDTQNGYNRVRLCAQARAVENEMYVAIAGCVGNLPKVANMDIQYSQSAVFSPSDFAFPNNAVVAEATPNTEMMVIADLNMDLLKELRAEGSVTNVQDRRLDLYSLRTKKKPRSR